MMMDKYRKVQTFTGLDLFLYAYDNYGKDYAYALTGHLSNEQREILSTCKHNRDGRTLEEYAQNLILNWIIEDYVMQRLQEQGYEVELNGTDKKREFLKNSQIEGKTDYLINQKPVELIVDFSGYWEREQVLHLRDNKYIQLKKAGAKLLCIDIINRSFCIIPLENTEAKEIIHPVWKKKAYELPVSSSSFQQLHYFKFTA